MFEGRTGLVITFAMIGKLCISAVFAVIYNYSAEFFPTVVRNAGTGFSSLCGKIGSVLAPQVTLLVFDFCFLFFQVEK